MEQWRKDARHEPIIVDLEALVPKDCLLRYGLRVVIRAPGSVLLPRQWPSRNRSGRAHKNGADTAPVWNPFLAADLPGNPGECCISVVSGVRAAG